MDTIINTLIGQFTDNLGSRITPALANGIIAEIVKVAKGLADAAEVARAEAKSSEQTPSE